MYFNMSVWQVSQNVSWCIIELGSDRVRLKAFGWWASTNSEADTHWKGRGLCSQNKPSRATMKSTWSWLDIVDLNATIATLYSLQPCQSKKRMVWTLVFAVSKKWQSIILYIEARFNLWHFPHTLIFEPLQKIICTHQHPFERFYPHELINCPLMANQWKRHFHLGFIDKKKERKKAHSAHWLLI